MAASSPAPDGLLVDDPLVDGAPADVRIGILIVAYNAASTLEQVLEIVLDAMHQAGKALPSKAVQALVDTAMELQRAGVPVKKSAFDAQLRAAL